MQKNCKWIAIKHCEEAILENLFTACKIILNVSNEKYTPETLLQLGFDDNQSMFLFNEDVLEGIILVNIQKKRNWVLLVMAISEHLQNLRLGTIALKSLISSARFENVESIELHVRVDNIGGREFYLNNGFEINHICKGLYQGSDGYRMLLKL